MSSAITEQPQPGRPVFELAYELDAEDHVAHFLWQHRDTALPWSARLGPRFFLGLLAAAGLIALPVLVPLSGSTVTRLVQNVLLFVSLFGVVLLLFLVTVPVHPAGVVGAPTGGVRRELVRALVANAVRQRVLRLGRRDRVSFDAAGFLEVTEYREQEADGFTLRELKETRVPWRRVLRVEAAEEHVFFVVADKGNLIVPRRVFADEAALAAFVDAVRQWRLAAALGPAPTDTRFTEG